MIEDSRTMCLKAIEDAYHEACSFKETLVAHQEFEKAGQMRVITTRLRAMMFITNITIGANHEHSLRASSGQRVGQRTHAEGCRGNLQRSRLQG